MNSNAGSVFGRITKRARWYGGGIAVLAAAAFASTGFVHLNLGRAAAPSPVVSNAPALNDATIAPLLALDRATEAVAARIAPSVVTITTVGKTKPEISMSQPDPGEIPEPFRQFFFQGPQQQQQPPQVFQAEGTGVIISPDGYIVTNNHVVRGATSVQVALNNQQTFDAKVVGTDSATDLAVLKINGSSLTSAEFGDSSQLQPGQTVLAIGDPLSMQSSVTRGIVSAVNRPRTASDGSDSRGTFIQTDAPINHGNSGGPLVNIYGDVVGINTEMLSSTGGSVGIGFAIPSNLVKSVAGELIKNGKVLRGYLGIQVTDLTPATADSLGDSGIRGALVNQVNADSPASKAGIKPYDVVTAVDGEAVTTGSDLQTISGGIAPGSTAHIDVVRDGKPMHMSAVLGDFDKANAATPAAETSDDTNANSTPKLGITVAPLDADARGQLHLSPSVNGVVVQSVEPGSPAMLGGVGQGDVIEQVNRHPVTSTDELKQQLNAAPAGKNILLMVHKANGDFILSVQPGR